MRLSLLAVVLALVGCGGWPYPDETPYIYRASGVVVRSAIPLNEAAIAENLERAVGRAREVTGTTPSIAGLYLYVHPTPSFDLDGQAVGGAQHGNVIVLGSTGVQMLHEFIHLSEDAQGRSKESLGHEGWEERGYWAAANEFAASPIPW